MAQTQPQQPPHHSPQYSPSQSFSPPVPTPHGATPPANIGVNPPPPKRQRLSPLPQSQSPYGSPSFGASQLPQNQPPGLHGSTVNGFSTPSPLPIATPVSVPNHNMSPVSIAPMTHVAPMAPAPPPPAPGSMGPPSRPAEKPTDAADLSDVLAQSGIDVREEEAYLTQSYAAPQTAVRPQLPGPSTSFASAPSTPGTTSAGASFDMSQGRLPATQEPQVVPAYSEDAPYNQPTYEETRAARRSQYHLQDPFLLTKVLEQKMQKRAYELGVRLPTEGLYHPMPGSRQPIEVTGPDGSSIVRRGHTIINQEGAPLVDIISLMSLCCEERVRGVVEYSASLSKSRRLHSHGIVPTEWQNLAAAKSTSGAVTDPVSKRKLFFILINAKFSSANCCSGPHSAIDNAASKPLADRYLLLSTKDMSDEQARAAKRAKRNANAIINETNAGSRTPSLDMGSGVATPTSQTALGLGKGVTKKEARKQLDTKASEAQQHQQSVETARKALSSTLFGGSKKRNYAWLNKGSGVNSMSSPRPLSPALGSSSGIGGGVDRNEKKRSESTATAVASRLGDWREDKAAGIQVRDILFMLEQDGGGSRHVQKAYSKDLQEERLS
jgi:Transcription initiation factor TFIID component TAF4 family